MTSEPKKHTHNVNICRVSPPKIQEDVNTLYEIECGGYIEIWRLSDAEKRSSNIHTISHDLSEGVSFKVNDGFIVDIDISKRGKCSKGGNILNYFHLYADNDNATNDSMNKLKEDWVIMI